nr:glycosyltransferase [Mycobacterium sp. 1245499.0]
MVDGRSTDETLDVARSFGSDLGARLVIHSGPDDGPYDAMNRGVQMATGEWLLFLGADDTLYEPGTEVGAEAARDVEGFVRRPAVDDNQF